MKEVLKMAKIDDINNATKTLKFRDATVEVLNLKQILMNHGVNFNQGTENGNPFNH